MTAPTAAPGALVEGAPAKINLCLHVVGRRADGYHELSSLVAFADVADRLSARAADALSLALEGPGAATLAADTAENLVLRAARLLAEACGRAPGAALVLEKRLPVASGIGGGSADAAATLRLLCRLWGVDPGREALYRIAARLGADVPVCLDGVPAWLEGIGERLAPAGTLPPLGILLVNPRQGLATPAVFKVRQGPFSAPARPAALPRTRDDFIAWLATTRNDLTAPALTLMPAIAQMLDALSATPGALLARMSGSGATCFALYATSGEAERAGELLAAAHPGWWVAPGMLLGG